jgi:hypothetical protein
MYGFNLGEMGLTFLSITVGVIIAIAAYWSYIYWVMEPEIRAHGLGAPERRLIPALASSICCPVGLFIFGWASNPDVHWIGSVVGVSIFTIGIFVRSTFFRSHCYTLLMTYRSFFNVFLCIFLSLIRNMPHPSSQAMISRVQRLLVPPSISRDHYMATWA